MDERSQVIGSSVVGVVDLPRIVAEKTPILIDGERPREILRKFIQNAEYVMFGAPGERQIGMVCPEVRSRDATRISPTGSMNTDGIALVSEAALMWAGYYQALAGNISEEEVLRSYGGVYKNWDQFTRSMYGRIDLINRAPKIEKVNRRKAPVDNRQFDMSQVEADSHRYVLENGVRTAMDTNLGLTMEMRQQADEKRRKIKVFATSGVTLVTTVACTVLGGVPSPTIAPLPTAVETKKTETSPAISTPTTKPTEKSATPVSTEVPRPVDRGGKYTTEQLKRIKEDPVILEQVRRLVDRWYLGYWVIAGEPVFGKDAINKGEIGLSYKFGDDGSCLVVLELGGRWILPPVDKISGVLMYGPPANIDTKIGHLNYEGTGPLFVDPVDKDGKWKVVVQNGLPVRVDAKTGAVLYTIDMKTGMWKEEAKVALVEVSRFYEMKGEGSSFIGEYQGLKVKITIGLHGNMLNRPLWPINSIKIKEEYKTEFTEYYLKTCWAAYNRTNNSNVTFDSYLGLLKAGKGQYAQSVVDERTAKDDKDRSIKMINPLDGFVLEMFDGGDLPIRLSQMNGVYFGINKNGEFVLVSSAVPVSTYLEVKEINPDLMDVLLPYRFTRNAWSQIKLLAEVIPKYVADRNSSYLSSGIEFGGLPSTLSLLKEFTNRLYKGDPKTAGTWFAIK